MGGVEIQLSMRLVASGILREKIYLFHTSQMALLSTDTGDTSFDSEFLNMTVETLGAAKQSISRSVKAEVAKRLEAINTNRVMQFLDQSSDFVVNIPTASANAMRLELYWLWHTRMGHVNPKRLGSLFHHVNGINQVNLLFLKHTKCNFSNMTQIVN